MAHENGCYTFASDEIVAPDSYKLAVGTFYIHIVYISAESLQHCWAYFVVEMRKRCFTSLKTSGIVIESNIAEGKKNENNGREFALAQLYL